MKLGNRLLVVLLPLVMLCAFTSAYRAGVPDATGHGDDERSIRQLNEQCLHAHDIGDADTLDRIEDADFTLSGDFGVVSKQQHLEKVRQRTIKREVITRKIDPQVFRFYDGVALVTETDRPTTKDGTFAFQSTEVWVRRGDSWKLVHLHYSPLADKQ
ncbi:MAG TPA: nuclear transport factor 2 family protein [Candidatus Solibacter sp.]|nr:nuclear transport factor 2 family protein [Candidatus Solibacter sp.]